MIAIAKSQFCHSAAKKCCGSGNLLIWQKILFLQKEMTESICFPHFCPVWSRIINWLFFYFWACIWRLAWRRTDKIKRNHSEIFINARYILIEILFHFFFQALHLVGADRGAHWARCFGLAGHPAGHGGQGPLYHHDCQLFKYWKKQERLCHELRSQTFLFPQNLIRNALALAVLPTNREFDIK